MEAREATFLFADIAGFTALTDAHGDHEALELMLAFRAEVDVLLPDYEGERIKSIGDALMIRLADPVSGTKLGLRLTGDMGSHGWPALAVGLHHGSAVRHEDDWFGSTVNLASRLAGLARSGEVLMEGGTRQMVGEQGGMRFRYCGDRRLRNIPQPLSIFAAERVAPEESPALALDPVCRMAVDAERAACHRTFDEEDYVFCSQHCRERFDTDPAAYVRSLSEASH